MKTLRVQIMDELWEELRPHLYHGAISEMLRRAIKLWLHNAKGVRKEKGQ